MSNIFSGLITAIVTPFQDNQLDLISLEKILEYQIKNNSDGVVIAGTTGEGSSLSFEEYKNLLQAAKQIVKKRIVIIAGCCSSNTEIALKLALEAEDIGIDGLMCTTPPYVKPTEEGVYQHIKAIHDKTNLPMMLYNTPSRSGTNISDQLVVRLANLPRVIALKDTGTDIARPIRMKTQIKSDFNFLTGEDETSLAYIALGGKGWVSVASNYVPALCKKLLEYCFNNDYAQALIIQQKLFALYQALFKESNPIPIKYALSYLGFCNNELRLPLCTASTDTEKMIRTEIIKLSEKI